MNVNFLKFIAKTLSYAIKSLNFIRMIISKIRMFIRGICNKIKMHFRKKADKNAKRALSNDYLYFVLKLAKVYSRNKEEVSVEQIYSMKRFCDEYKQTYRIIEEPHEVPVCSPEYYGTSDEYVENYETEEIYIAELSDAVVSGSSSVVMCQEQYIYDAIAFDEEKRLDVKFADFIAALDGKFYFEHAEIDRRIDKAVFLLGFASYNYYHLTIEIMSRLRYVNEYAEYDDYPVLVDEVISRTPQYRELLNRINTTNREIIYVKEGDRIQVGHLVYPSYNTWMPINVKDRDDIRLSDFVMSETGLQNLRESVPLHNEVHNKKIFVSRENVTASRLENEKEIRELFKENGFTIIHAENMSFEEQVECFNSANCIVAASGAALTNIVYCQPATVVCCMIPAEYNFYAYATIAYMLDLKPVFLDAEVTERTPYPAMDMFRVDINKCEEFIAEYA